MTQGYEVVRGSGPPLVLVHGSAADADGWTTQLATLASDFRMLAYDRRGTPRSPAGRPSYSVEDHAADLLDAARRLCDGPVWAVGSSFGAVCLLEAARRSPGAFFGIALIEPPLPESDAAPAVPESYLTELERLAQEESGEASAEFFLRYVLGKEALDAMPARWRARAVALHEAIRLDSAALAAYPPRYSELKSLDLPVLLLGGGRSAPHFRITLRALARALPRARLEILPSAGHMLHADASRRFAALLREFAGLSPRADDSDRR